MLGEPASSLLPDDPSKPPASTKEGERESRRKPPVPSRFAEVRQKREKSKPNIEKKEEFEYKIKEDSRPQGLSSDSELRSIDVAAAVEAHFESG